MAFNELAVLYKFASEFPKHQSIGIIVEATELFSMVKYVQFD